METEGVGVWLHSARVVADALSEVSVTAAAMARYHLDAALKKELAQKLGALRAAQIPPARRRRSPVRSASSGHAGARGRFATTLAAVRR
jgi:hypothetical protein